MKQSQQLAKGAMLVSVQIVNGGLLGERKDATASELVENTYQVANKRTKASKYLIDRKHKKVKAVVAASQRVREVLYKYTNPWADDKSRLLVAKLEPEFREKLDAAISELKDSWVDYRNVYPSLIADSERDLNELFDRSQYPSADKIMEMFKVNVRYWPFPVAGNFVADISEEAAKAAKQEIEAAIEERLVMATFDMVTRAKDAVSSLLDRLDGFDKKSNLNARKAFRDSLLNNIETTANLIETMNITENMAIKKVVKDLNRLIAVAWNSSSILRKSADIREKTKLAGKEILASLEVLDVRDQEIAEMLDGASDYLD